MVWIYKVQSTQCISTVSFARRKDDGTCMCVITSITVFVSPFLSIIYIHTHMHTCLKRHPVFGCFLYSVNYVFQFVHLRGLTKKMYSMAGFNTVFFIGEASDLVCFRLFNHKVCHSP